MTGPLKAPCEHGRYEEHDKRGWPVLEDRRCPGGTLLPEDTLVIVKEDGRWPHWAASIIFDYLANDLSAEQILDALAAAQRGDE